ncbi:hypothetical protein [Glycomyces paridis]|uniref:Asp23/Gls24 family envelope stress response protein n=1 Tax=Glycomyces paridis TaxID=2126555 RepID=A0A4S8PM92_9ACTN|nr:hypothetical protein [Glycomyces paridis]THV30855.1 hypothetical protein E9998_05630 [Glycomyces paridis]
MTEEAFAIADLPGGPERAAEERGSLRVTGTAVTRVFEGAARGAPGSAERSGLLVRGYPRARATVKHGRVWASLDVGVRWPGPTAATARGLAARVREEATRITGLDVVALDVTVHLVDAADGAERRVQ